MALRERIKKTFSRNQSAGNSESSSTLSKTNSKQTSRRSSKDKNHQYYKPGEKIPQSKYRRPVDPEHKARLEAFSFSDAWRRMSGQSQYSPMGSRMPSRRGSMVSNVRRSMGSRRGGSSIGTAPDDRDVAPSARPPALDADNDSAIQTDARPSTSTKKLDRPFSQEDLNMALKRTHLEVPV